VRTALVCAIVAVTEQRLILRVNKFNYYTQGFIADVDGHTTLEITYINGRIECDAFILLISVVSSRRADRSPNNE
jgi:hypothetical protein